MNWDAPGISQQLREGKLPSNKPRVILDEIHKYKNWRNLIKDLYDWIITARVVTLWWEDLRDLEIVKEISLVEQLAELLPSKAGAGLSIKKITRKMVYVFCLSQYFAKK